MTGYGEWVGEERLPNGDVVTGPRPKPPLDRIADATADIAILLFEQFRGETDRYRAAIVAARDALADQNAMAEDTDSPANMAFAILNHALDRSSLDGAGASHGKERRS